MPAPPSTRSGAVKTTDRDPQRSFGFVQFDFAGTAGIPAGRWVVRESAENEPSHVLVVEVLPGGKPTRKQRSIKSPPSPAALTVTRVTVVDAAENCRDRAERIDAALAVIERAIHAQAIADGGGTPVVAAPAWIGLRIGTGSGEQVAHGDWDQADEIPLPETARASKRRAEPSKGRFAEILGGKASEEDLAQLAAAADSAAALRDALSPRG